MSKRLFIKSVGNIDDELLERFNEIDNRLSQKRSYKPLILKISAIAACFCVIIGSVLAAMYFGGNDTQISESGQTSEPFLSEHKVMPENTFWINSAVSEQGGMSGGTHEAAPVYDQIYLYNMTVIGKAKSVLPDIYSRLGASAAELRYKILTVEITDTIHAESIPKEIYLMIPSYLDATALLDYDEIIFAISQKGVGDCPIINETKRRAEAFYNLFWCSDAAFGAILAFTDGEFDTSLWQKKGWRNSFYSEDSLNNFFSGSRFPVHIGYDIDEAAEAINDFINAYPFGKFAKTVSRNDFDFDEAKKVFEYTQPFENGIFAQDCILQKQSTIFFMRYINGFPTNEEIRVSQTDSEVNYYGEKFSQEDLNGLTDLGIFFDTLDLDSYSPSHTELEEEHETSAPTISGKYIKKNGRVYSIARIAWRLTPMHGDYYFLDDTYLLLAPDGGAKIIDREELRALVGDDEFITVFEYDNPIYPIVE